MSRFRLPTPARARQWAGVTLLVCLLWGLFVLLGFPAAPLLGGMARQLPGVGAMQSSS